MRVPAFAVEPRGLPLDSSSLRSFDAPLRGQLALRSTQLEGVHDAVSSASRATIENDGFRAWFRIRVMDELVETARSGQRLETDTPAPSSDLHVFRMCTAVLRGAPTRGLYTDRIGIDTLSRPAPTRFIFCFQHFDRRTRWYAPCSSARRTARRPEHQSLLRQRKELE